jgi:micrococcal nuclease
LIKFELKHDINILKLRPIEKSCAIWLFVILSVIGNAQSYKGKITKVVDGDTYFFQTANETLKVRMFGIDAPEGNQPFGKESKEFISKYLYKDATLVTHGHDQYKRTLGTLFIDGQDINLVSVKGGYSWHYKRYLNDKQYAEAQENAKKLKLGLWSFSNPIPPWNFRHTEKEEGTFHHK